jgi:hypothetical protein
VLLGGGLVGGGALAVVGTLAVGGPGLVGIGLGAALAACTAAGIVREAPASMRGSALEAAVRAAGAVAGGLLVVAGLATVAGGVAAALAVVAVLVVVVVRVLRKPRPTASSAAATTHRRTPVGEVLGLPPSRPAARPGPVPAVGLRPVATLTTRAIGDEWLRTTAALSGRLPSAARAALVLRREEILDELERRDPDGFAVWLAAGPTRGSDPADYVRGGPARPGPVADTDAA